MTHTIDGGILAGGRSSRMGGEDKGLKLLNGQPMVQHVADAMRNHVDKLWINCAPEQVGYEGFSPYICRDMVGAYQGPLAGLHSLLSASKADYVLTSPCDTPYLSEVYAQRMLSHLQQQSSAGNPRVLLGAKASGRFHCLHLCVPTSVLHSLTAFLANGQHKVFNWLNSLHIQWVDFTDHAQDFDNINSPQQLHRYLDSD